MCQGYNEIGRSVPFKEKRKGLTPGIWTRKNEERVEKGKREGETGKDEQSMSDYCTAFRELRIESQRAV